jgi:hypothetical protein
MFGIIAMLSLSVIAWSVHLRARGDVAITCWPQVGSARPPGTAVAAQSDLDVAFSPASSSARYVAAVTIWTRWISTPGLHPEALDRGRVSGGMIGGYQRFRSATRGAPATQRRRGSEVDDRPLGDALEAADRLMLSV